MNVKEELYIAVTTGQKATLQLNGDEIITGVAEIPNDPKGAKIRTSEGPVWVPYEYISNIEWIAQILH